MNDDVAKKLVKDALENSFDKEKFSLLVRNILNAYETGGKIPFTYKGSIIFRSFEKHIQSIERIGKYTDPEDKVIDILIVKIRKEGTLERARGIQRNYIATYLNGRRGYIQKIGALVAFVSPNQEHWRFSFIKMEYRWEEGGEIRRKFTPVRRYSFLVGKTERSHTAQGRFLPLLKEDNINPTVKCLENAFSIESVTEEFFSEYRNLFYNLKESLDKISANDKKIQSEFNKRHIKHSDFVKKLLGQIVFLYFLQKKGWFGVEKNQEWGTGSRHFLRELFEKKHGEYENFFNDILEPLFYEALGIERTNDYYSRFNCKIPFLNGGLFDPINDYDWVDTDIPLPNDIFANNNDTKDGDHGNGILDIFDRYNFTVKEDEPLEKEVAVDPEMLGKVFENLLEITDRRSQGTYYTPRMIIHYMCQESLINYLLTEFEGEIEAKDITMLVRYGESTIEHESHIISQNRETKTYRHSLPETIRNNATVIDKKLEDIRICEPAVGSGAFLVGMMNEIVGIRNALTPFLGTKKERTSYHFKRHAIENCLYGVDNDPGAIEIAKLRLWLSLIVDETDREKIQPLPNLDYKIVCGDSLLAARKDTLNGYKFTELEKIKAIYLNETQIGKKKQHKKKIDRLIHELTDNQENFDFEVYFSEIFREQEKPERKNFLKQIGFDIVIANPPYIQLQKDRGRLAKKYAPSKDRHFRYETFDKRGDIYILFYEKGLKILKQKGTLCFITSNKWMQAVYGTAFRDYLRKNTQVLFLLDMGADVFREATVDTNIILMKKIKDHSSDSCKAMRVESMELEKHNSLSEYAEKHSMDISLPEQEQPWIITTPSEQTLKHKIDKISIPLKNLNISINIGIKTGFNGAFIIDDKTKNALVNESPESEKILKPILRGKDINRYQTDWAGLWLINTHNGYENVLPIYIDDYPAVKKHLDQFYPRLQKRQDKGVTPYNLRHCAYHAEFEREKVVWTAVNSEYRSAILPQNYYLNNSLFMITGDHIKFICAYINSKLGRKYLEWILSGEDSYTYASKKIVELLPIPKPTEENKIEFMQIEQLVDKITNSDFQSTVYKESENLINKLIYSIYNLTQKEIEIVENNVT